MHESEIIIDAADQAAVRRAARTAVLPVKTLVGGAIALVVALGIFGFIAASDRPVGVFGRLGFIGLGAVLAFAMLFLMMVLVVRTSTAWPVVRDLPLGARIRVRADAEGLAYEGPVGASRLRWDGISRVTRLGGAIVVHDLAGKPWSMLPGRSLDDAALAAVADWAAEAAAQRSAPAAG